MTLDQFPSLLLLPFPPDPPTRASLNAAYRTSLQQALTRLKRAHGASKLIVAVGGPILNGSTAKDRSLSWPEAQSLVAGIYTIIAVVCANEGIGTDVNGGPGSVDSTVVLVHYGRKARFPPDFRPAIEPNNTVVVDLPTFASAYFPWNYIFNVNSETGYRLQEAFLKFAERKQTILQERLVTVEGGLTMFLEFTEVPKQTTGFSTVCLGGTFDHLHPGHKLMLSAATYLLQVPDKSSGKSCQVIVGITGDELLKNKKYAELVQPWDERARNVLDHLWTVLELSPKGWTERVGPDVTENDGDFQASFRDGTIRVQCVRIQDAFGPTITTEDMDALVVSGETRSGGAAVNDKRSGRGWKQLQIHEVDVLDAEEITSDEAPKAEDFSAKISSTSIRQQKAQATAS